MAKVSVPETEARMEERSAHTAPRSPISPEPEGGTAAWGGTHAAANPPRACAARCQGELPDPARCAATTQRRLFCTNTIIKVFAWYYTEKYSQILPLLH